MFGFLGKRLLIARRRDSTPALRYLHNPFLKSISHISNSEKESSFTVSYLVNFCGLSSERALSIAKKVHLEDKKKPNSVLKFFENHGFSKTQIEKVITKRPLLLLADPVKSFEPKVQFFRQFGISGPNLTKFISSDPAILTRSLEKQIIPSWNFLKTLLHTDNNVVLAIYRNCASWILQFNAQTMLAPKVEILLNHGVPESNISKFIMLYPGRLTQNNDRFSEFVKKICEMGFDPSSTMFIKALGIKSGMSTATWDAKLRVYKSFGWSDDEIFCLFRKGPNCISISEENIRTKLDFFMNKLNLKPSVLSRNPVIFSLSLENRIVPRISVIQVLLSKGFMKNNVSLGTVLVMNDMKFRDKFVTRYKHEITDLINVFQGKI
ncbi:PREDICTED: transcription termination factor MTERF8, chloroplastic-like [Nelumbo nucifera]|uniref:Transcription termination factor MTERF8, chloroplastic-like n=2 Tax=Nelumbo nucifera TaxID=4432 RepID=A0A1U7ZS45_NELNU|nr:PREDICTED: transcription termination factor MTERF8, chloroplastic-like [Nelumbo nucifera]DAD39306.1 TPA_asm: hypothetical protein HUJ06_013629 [Nelumbo nucifera]